MLIWLFWDYGVFGDHFFLHDISVIS